MKTVFLSGPIRGLSREDSMNWRNMAHELLSNDFNVVHALRGREVEETLPDPRLAIIRDKVDIDNADIILVNDTLPNASMIGTAMEVIYAHQKNKVIIIFGNGHEKDYWLNYHSYARVESLENACALVLQFFK